MRQQLGGFGDVGGNAARDRGDSGVPGRADDLGHVALARQLPGDRVLARTAADDQDLHGVRLTAWQDWEFSAERS